MVRKQYAEGPLVKVAYARHQAEAELIQGLLLEAGVPSSVSRPGGSSVPIMSTPASHVLVPASGVEVAREALAGASLAPDGARRERTPRPAGLRVVAAALVDKPLTSSPPVNAKTP